MPSIDVFTPLAALLTDDADADGIRAVVNAVVPALIPAGGVIVSRERFTESTRRKVSTSSVAVIPRGESGPPEQVGTGYDVLEEEVEAEVVLRRKDLPKGSTALDTLSSYYWRAKTARGNDYLGGYTVGRVSLNISR